MENHPIPQDVTGFQFKLVGNMTVKQFAFVGAGIVIAVLLYYAPNPGNSFLITLLKFILVPISGLSGVVVAFIPIEGRSVDVMLANFFKAIFAPNQYVYQKVGRHYAVTTIHTHPVSKKQSAKDSASAQATRLREKQLQSYLSAVSQAPRNSLDEKEARFLESVTQAPAPLPQQQVKPVSQPAPTPPPASQPTHPVPVAPPENEDRHGEHLRSSDLTPEQKEAELVQKEAQLKEELVKSHTDETTPGKAPQAAYVAHLHTVDLEKQLNDVSSQKQQLEQELMQLKSQLSLQKQAGVLESAQAQLANATAKVIPQHETKSTEQHVRKVPFSHGKNVGLPNAPEDANLIVGIIKDSRGNVLNNILVEVKDKQGNPVRAFKSNTLGQFASATPLPLGSYTITFEDPKNEHTFDVIEIHVKGEIIEPIEVISHDAREELRKALFN